ncbi:hypothetical protein HKBW3S43_00786 [Candidatus Hakubella thermalkaliphila]|uniref:Uncharacterized protein n=1 Tax=Candidatus Hakubella thermalkaliphila TaxID=2754717 RepID=A0A6V8P8A9_9ACTN|nr:hypothetical protein [Candidatus Hakubella thermalkaliphila]GFP28583.1 hypothetical protein HKBW3S33_01997 [Candidatus Hakubella thermalkaliphila]GFP34994.1 hypothetical protein HKBW3S43_00786 [Candidatus Hakubella thermalkaliphila]
MQKLTVEIPEDLVEATRLSREEIPPQDREVVETLWRKGKN